VISRCTRCGTGLDYPVYDPAADFAYCDRCEDAFQASMREQFPHGQCPTCGCKYDLYDKACERCYGLGEKPVVSGIGVTWEPCRDCHGYGSFKVADGLHEETLCGLREDWEEAMWCRLGRMPTREDVLGWAIENEARRETEAARMVNRLAGWRVVDEVDDIPF
jgi:hypothetical protein